MNMHGHNTHDRRGHRRTLIVLLAVAAAFLAGCNSAPKRNLSSPRYRRRRSAGAPGQRLDLPGRLRTQLVRERSGTPRRRYPAGQPGRGHRRPSTPTRHSVSKSNSPSVTPPTVFGKLFSGLEQSLESGASFFGDADNTQNNEFNGSISVVVTEVLPNGYICIRGEKRIIRPAATNISACPASYAPKTSTCATRLNRPVSPTPR